MNRSIRAVVPAVQTFEGEGFLVHRPFPTRALSEVDPFVLLDEMGPIEVALGEAKGAPDHPHRGFEIITYLLEGAMEHRDSHGNRGFIGNGDAQYMLAGDGVIHSEMPAAELQRTGGRVHGIQLWINLPARDKALAPRYVDVRAADVPTYDGAGFRARVLAGELFGLRAPLQTRHPADYGHVTLEPNAVFALDVDRTKTALVYPLAGDIAVAKRRLRHGELAILHDDGDRIEIGEGANARAEFLLLASAPIGEPIARYGPFVMNTVEDIQRTLDDYREGRFGRIEPLAAT